MSDTPRSLGERIASHRKRRGLSQVEFARLVGRSESWVSQVERDTRKVDRISVLAQVAEVLGVPVSELAPDAPTPAAPGRPPQLEVLRLALVGHPALAEVLATRPAAEPVAADVAELADRCESAWADVHRSRYRQVSPTLADLIGDLEAASRNAAGGGQDRDAVGRLLVSAYQAASAVLAKVGETDAAWVASDRAVSAADRVGDPGLLFASQFRLTVSLLGSGRAGDALHAGEKAVGALDGVTDPPADLTSLRGAFELLMAVAAARLGDRRQAWEHITQAEQAAEHLGTDRDDYDTEFGPTNVAVQAVSVAVELGDAGEALDRASRVDVSALSVERRARFLLDVAAANTQRRRAGEAVTALLEAEEIAPEQILGHPLFRDLVRDLHGDGRDTDPRLHALATRLSEHESH